MLDEADKEILLRILSCPPDERVAAMTQGGAGEEVRIGKTTVLEGSFYAEGLRRLLRCGYLDRVSGRGCRLSPAGRRVGEELQRSLRGGPAEPVNE